MKQRLLYILNDRWPTIRAYGLQVAKTCQGLSQAGGRVRLVVPKRARHNQSKGVDAFLFYGIGDSFPVTWLPSIDMARLGLNARPFFLLQQFISAILAALYVAVNGGYVYSRDPMTVFLLSFLRKGGVIFEAHRFPKHVTSWYWKRILASVSGIVAISNGLRDYFLPLTSPGQSIVIEDGVDVEQFNISQTPEEARAHLGLPAGVPLLGYVGQLRTLGMDKGISLLLEALVLLSADGRPVHCVCVGGHAQDVQWYQEMARSLGVAHMISFLGFRPPTEIPLFLRAFHALVMPFPRNEHFSYYMSPLKMFEYMAAGKPIIASDLPSVREVLNDANAYMVVPDDAFALKSGIVDALHDKEGHRATQALYDVERYSWKKRGERILSFIASRL